MVNDGDTSQDFIRVTYISTHGGISEQDCLLLSREAGELNATHDISGLLIVGDEDFFVVLEGDPTTVTSALASIAQDQRHHSVTVLFADIVQERICKGWPLISLGHLAKSKGDTAGGIHLASFNPRQMSRQELTSAIVELAYMARDIPLLHAH